MKNFHGKYCMFLLWFVGNCIGRCKIFLLWLLSDARKSSFMARLQNSVLHCKYIRDLYV